MLIASGSNRIKTNTLPPLIFFSQPNTIPCSPLIDRGTHRTKENSVALLAASLRSALGPNCLISTSGAHSDLRFSIQVTSACPHPPASLFALPFSLKNTTNRKPQDQIPNCFSQSSERFWSGPCGQPRPRSIQGGSALSFFPPL